MNVRNTVASMFAPLLVHNQNQQAALHRAVAARAAGLDPAQYGSVYPGSRVTTTNHNGTGYVKGALLAAALLAGGGGSAAYLVGALPGAGTPPSAGAPAAKPTAPAPKPQSWDAITEEQQPDGSWKPVKREHLRGLP